MKFGFINILLILSFQSAIAQNLEFPSDEGKHSGVDFETWTFFSHVSDADRNQFGITIIFFTGKVVGLNASGINVTIVDERLKDYQIFQKIQYPIINRAKHTQGALFEKYGRNILRRDTLQGAYKVSVDINDFELAFSMDPEKQPVDIGRIPVGGEKYNRLYAVSRGKVTATMRYRNQDHLLSGIGFFQHQWGDSPEKKSASDLFVIHFNDTTDVLVYHNSEFSRMNTIVLSTNSDSNAIFREFTASPDTVITAASTQDLFPLRWKIAMEKPPLFINLKPLDNGQEVKILGLSYWISRCTVNGQIGGRKLIGRGNTHLRSILHND